MAEIKSTLEIIMEKAKGLNASEEEKKEFKRKEMAGKIKGLIQKFLDGQMNIEKINDEISGLQKENEELYREVMLGEAINLIDPEQDNEPVLELLEKTTGMDTDDIRAILNEFKNTVEKEQASCRTLMMEKLRDGGVSGSAVIPNLNSNLEWKEYIREQKGSFRRDIARSVDI